MWNGVNRRFKGIQSMLKRRRTDRNASDDSSGIQSNGYPGIAPTFDAPSESSNRDSDNASYSGGGGTFDGGGSSGDWSSSDSGSSSSDSGSSDSGGGGSSD